MRGAGLGSIVAACALAAGALAPAAAGAAHAGPAQVGSLVTPVIGKLHVQPGAVSRRGSARVLYQDNQPATTTLAIARGAAGVVRAGACVPAPRRVGSGTRRCTRYATVATLEHTDRVGGNSVPFPASVLARLPPGRYRVEAVPRTFTGLTGPSVKALFAVR